MTTICYNHHGKQVAWDSRRTINNTITDDNAQKMIERNGVKFWVTGCYADANRLVDYYFGCEKHEFKPDACALVFDNGDMFAIGVTDEHECWKEEIECNCTMGSGQDFATAAMDFGCDAQGAVEYAKTRDCKTGGKVRVFNLPTKGVQ